MAETVISHGGKTSRVWSRPWTQAFIEALPGEPAWGGLALAAGHLSLGFVYLWLVGAPIRAVPDVVFALLVGAAPAASVYARRATLGCLRDLRPALDIPESRFAEFAEDIVRWDRLWTRLSGVSAAVVTVVVCLNEPGVIGPHPPGDPVLPWILWMNLASIWLSTRTITPEIIVSRRFARLGRDHAVIDVLDQAPLTPFSRRGVQGALVPILLISIFSLLFVSGSAGDAVPFTQVFVVGIAAFSLLLPIHGVHLRLTEEKRRRLAQLADAIRESEGPVLTARPGEARDEAAHLHVLLALRSQIESAREWPWDVPTLVRFGFYVAIGLGSWLGGALVERVVDFALG
jgi:hypothetical protein